MKKLLLFFFALTGVLAFTSCSEDDENTGAPTGGVKQVYVNASERDQWSYYSLATNKLVGTGAENETDNAKWGARKDWDIAINRYMVRTNSGDFTKVGAQGGVYTCAEAVTFGGLTELPANVQFEADQTITSQGMQGTTTVVKSSATVIQFKKDAEGNLMMPPVYLKSPIYIFHAADSKTCYKLEFTHYKNENGDSGHVRFNYAEIK